MLESLGFSSRRHDELQRDAHRLGVPLRPARVASEHRNLYDLLVCGESLQAPLTGRLRHELVLSGQLPKVGDWVGLGPADRIEAVLSRDSVLQRKAAGSPSGTQVIATNVDWVMIVTSANRDFNPRRIERYVAATMEGGARPVLVLNKVDLSDNVEALLQTLEGDCHGLPVARISALKEEGFEQLQPFLQNRPTIVLVGSSGVGKSTLTNWLLGMNTAATRPIRSTDDHGKHTTSNRCLYPLPGGGALIDTPGMREFGLAQERRNQLSGFDDIERWVRACRFGDCQHAGQPGCAVQHALDTEELSAQRWSNYQKLQREVRHQQEAGTIAHQQEVKRRGKQFATRWRQRKRGLLSES